MTTRAGERAGGGGGAEHIFCHLHNMVSSGQFSFYSMQSAEQHCWNIS